MEHSMDDSVLARAEAFLQQHTPSTTVMSPNDAPASFNFMRMVHSMGQRLPPAMPGFMMPQGPPYGPTAYGPTSTLTFGGQFYAEPNLPLPDQDQIQTPTAARAMHEAETARFGFFSALEYLKQLLPPPLMQRRMSLDGSHILPEITISHANARMAELDAMRALATYKSAVDTILAEVAAPLGMAHQVQGRESISQSAAVTALKNDYEELRKENERLREQASHAQRGNQPSPAPAAARPSTSSRQPASP